jgi:energy-coupling factor transport system permease protein
MSSTLSTSIRNLGPASWRTIELVTTAMLGVAFGVAYWGWSLATGGLSTAFNAYLPASGVLGGPWLIAGVVGGLIIRKPGAALLAELLAANVEYLIGNEWGASTMVSGLLQGLGVEIVLAVFLYRRFGVVVAVLGGIVAASIESVYEWSAYFDYWDRAEQLAYLACFAASGAVVAGVGGWALVRSLAATGALDAFAAGREHRDRHPV